MGSWVVVKDFSCHRFLPLYRIILHGQHMDNLDSFVEFGYIQCAHASFFCTWFYWFYFFGHGSQLSSRILLVASNVLAHCALHWNHWPFRLIQLHWPLSNTNHCPIQPTSLYQSWHFVFHVDSKFGVTRLRHPNHWPFSLWVQHLRHHLINMLYHNVLFAKGPQAFSVTVLRLATPHWFINVAFFRPSSNSLLSSLFVVIISNSHGLFIVIFMVIFKCLQGFFIK